MSSFPTIILICYSLSIVVIVWVWATQLKHEVFPVIDPLGATYQIHALLTGYRKNFHLVMMMDSLRLHLKIPWPYPLPDTKFSLSLNPWMTLTKMGGPT